MNQRIKYLKKNIEPLRQEIINHKVYSAIKSIDDLKIIMQYHIYAVWDFMSMLKSLQNNLTCTTIPWFPKGTADTRYLINEIVVAEESDLDIDGKRKSHLEMYLDAMNQCGADTPKIEKFTNQLKINSDFKKAYHNAETPLEASNFVNYTFEIIKSNKPYLQSAILTFGREDLIPGMFLTLINEIHKNFPNAISKFKYYIERHIEIDGGHHGDLSLQMTTTLCGENEQFWKEAELAVIQSLEKRMELWDGIFKEIENRSLRSDSNFAGMII